MFSPIVFNYWQEKVADFSTLNLLLRESQVVKKEKQFLCLNKEPRFTRMALLHGLRSENLFGEGYVSIRQNLNYPNSLVKGTSEYSNKLRQDMNFPLELMSADDIETIPGDNTIIAKTIPVNLMAKSYYDLVNETTTRYELENVTDQAVITEKLFKSLYFLRPFLLNAGPHTLNLLKDLGFRTCDWLFDESFDSLINPIDRHEVIVNNIKNYKNNYKLLETRIRDNMDSLIHNYNHVKNLNIEDYLIRNLKSI